MGKDKRMTGQKSGTSWKTICICLILLLALTVSFFLKYLQIDISALKDILPEVWQESLEDILSSIFNLAEKVSITGYGAAGMVFRKSAGIFAGTVGEEVVRKLGILTVVPYLILLPGILLLLWRRTGSYAASAVSGLASLGFTIWSTFQKLPEEFYNLIPDDFSSGIVKKVLDVGEVGGELAEKLFGSSKLSEAVESAREATELITPGLFRDIIRHCLGPGWYLLMITAAVLTIAAVIGIVLMRKDRAGMNLPGAAVKPGPDHVYAIRCEFGELMGANLPLREGERIIIGTDPVKCNLILPAVNIDPVHCAVSFQPDEGCYILKDYSEHGIWTATSRKKIVPAGDRVPAGTRIYLGTLDNSLFLE